MAEILDGLSDHKSHAPLSTQQTIAICQYLQQVSKSNTDKIETLFEKLTQNEMERRQLRNDVSLNTNQVEIVRGEISDIKLDIRKNAGEAAQALRVCEQLKAAIVKTSEDFTLLREGQSVTNTNVHNLKGDLKMRSDDVVAVRAEVETVIKKQLVHLQEKQNSTVLSLKEVTNDHSKTKNDVWQHKEWLSKHGENLNKIQDETRFLQEELKTQGYHISETAGNCEKTNKNLELTNGIVLKLSEGVEAVQVSEASLLEHVRSIQADYRRLADEETQTAKGVQINYESFERLQCEVKTHRQDLSKAENAISALQQDQSRVNGVAQKLNADIQRVGVTVADTKANLQATQAIVLPNLGADELVPMSSRGSGNMMDSTRSMGGTSSKMSPRKKKEATWTARNIGSVPDRMSWI